MFKKQQERLGMLNRRVDDIKKHLSQGPWVAQPVSGLLTY